MDIVESVLGFSFTSLFGNVVLAACVVLLLAVFLGRRIFTLKGLTVGAGIVVIVLGGGALYRHLSVFKGPGFAFYEGNAASQDNVCNIDSRATEINLKNHNCSNDEIRSVKLLDIEAGTLLQVFDHPDGRMEDDWAEIYIKKDVQEYVIPTFESPINDEFVELYYSRNDGIDGKISRVKVSLDASMSSTIALFEGDNLTQNKVCEIKVGVPTTINFKNNTQCDNDEARSALLRLIPAGTRIRMFDSPSGSTKDDWLDIYVLKDLVELKIPTLQPRKDTFTAEHILQFHRNNTLDGKVSRIEISKEPPRATAVFYEGNNGRQNIVCSLDLSKPIGGKLRSLGCSNDEARSVVLFNMSGGELLRVYDSPGASKNDDWTELYANKAFTRKLIPTFSKNDLGGEVVVHAHRNNGIDGKVSYLEFARSKPAALIDLYEGNRGKQNRICSLPVRPGLKAKFTSHSCTNDEARSMVVHRAPAGTVIRVFDNPDGKREDDWAEIEIRKYRDIWSINSYQSEADNQNLRINYFRNNGLDGKVSRLEVHPKGSITRLLSFYEDNNLKQNKVCDVTPKGAGRLKFKSTNQCDNDEARSVRLVNLKAGYKFSVYDDPNCGKGDDWALITVKRDISSKAIGTFQQSVNTADFSLAYHKKNGLDGKVSCVMFGR